MDWLVRARALVAEAESLDLTIEDLVAAARNQAPLPLRRADRGGI